MIIRKPYAILIKHFKLIHAILLIAMIYLLYRTGMIGSFYNDYFASDIGVIGQELTDGLFSNLMYVTIFAIIIGLTTVLVLMRLKEKPIKYYIAGIIAYIALYIFLIVSQGMINQMESELLSARTVRAFSDLNNIAFILQCIMIIITFVRATGFNFKQFDFEKDMVELNITEEDSEEVEVGVDLDTGKFKRGFRRRIRHMKYAYLENKLFSNIIIVIVVLISGYFIYTKSGINEKIYSQGQSFHTIDFAMKIDHSYIVDTDYRNVKLAKGKTLVVLQLSIKNLYTTPVKFETAKAQLAVDGKAYYPTSQYKDEISDFGDLYDNKKIDKNEHYYVLCYEIPSNYLNKKMLFRYIDSLSAKKKKVKAIYVRSTIEPLDLRKQQPTKKLKLKDSIQFDKNILGNTTLVINSYEIKEEYKIAYNFCSMTDECYESYEYIKPNILNENKKVLLKLNTKFQVDTNYMNEKYRDVYNFLNVFAEINYIVDGHSRTFNGNLKRVVPNKVETGDDLYLEIPEEVKNATQIKMVLNFRNQEYEYTIK